MPLGLIAVKLTGGEPLIHPHIEAIINHIRECDLKLSIETNGACCTRELARMIKSSKDAFVSVSLDGADAETHEWMRGVEGCFRDALAGIENLVNCGIRPQIIMSVVRRNRHQMKAVVELAESLGAGSVKFNVVQPTARGEQMHQEGETLTIQELVETGAWVEGELSADAGIALYYSHPVAFRPLSRMFGPSGDGCGVCGILGILGVLSDGSYAMCGIGELVPELVFGNAQRDDLAKVWSDSPILNQLREGLPHRLEGICGECLMRNICWGSCIAQNFYRTGSLWEPYWYCRQAESQGLFPRSRRREAPGQLSG